MRITNEILLAEFKRSKELGEITDEMANLWLEMVDRILNKSNFVNFPHKEDMFEHALVNLCSNWMKFDPVKSDNIFAYYHSCILGSFVNLFAKERKEEKIKKDSLLL